MDLGGWLRSLGLEQYEAAFRDNAIDDTVLLSLTADDLKEMGVGPIGHRRKLLDAIAKLRADGNAKATSPAPLPIIDKSRPETAERRQLTVMFCDLVGSTALSAKLDPEDLRETITSYQNAVAGVVTRFQGHIAKYMGDGVLCYFGWPEAHEDDAERAARAALAIIKALAGLKAPGGEALSARIGIATGLVVVGDLIGKGAAQEEAVVGETPNLAARLQTLAMPGQIVVAESTRKLFGDVFELADLGRHQLKGIPGQASAFAVMSERPVESRYEAHASGAVSGMVGRDHELALILARWKQAKAGEGQLVLLSGEAGIGKSRVSRAVVDSVAKEPHVRIRFQCSPYHTDSPLFPAIQRLTLSAGITSADSNDAKLDKLEKILIVDENSRPLIAALLDLKYAERYGQLTLTPQQQRARTLQALVAQLIGQARAGPLLCVVEDAHWIDPMTLEFIDLCLDQAARARILILVTGRPTFQHGFGGHPIVTKLTLNRLGREPITAIVDNLAHGKSLPDAIIDEIAAKTDGVPLFVEELTKTILESGELKETASGYQLTSPLSHLVIPASLHASLMARLDRLQPVKEVAQTAACIGREFEYRLLKAISPLADAALQDALDRLMSAELIFGRGRPPEAKYIFKHALVRDAAYESLLKTRRQIIHGKLVGALEKEDMVPPELIAHHAAIAGMTDKAITNWRQAGIAATARPAYQEAIAHLTNALSLVQQGGESRARLESELDLQVMLAHALIPKEGYNAEPTARAFARALEIVKQIGETPHRFPVLYGSWVAHNIRGETALALTQARDVLDLANKQDDDDARLVALRLTGVSHFALGNLDAARRDLNLSLSFYRPAEHGRLVRRFGLEPGITTLCFLYIVCWLMGYPDQADEHARAAQRLTDQADHVNTTANTSFLLSAFALCTHNDSLLEYHSGRLQILSKEHDLVAYQAFSDMSLGISVAMHGHESGIEQFKKGFSKQMATGVLIFTPNYVINQAPALLSLGKIAAARGEVGVAQKLLSATGHRWTEPEIHRIDGDVCLAEGDPATGVACYQNAIKVARQLEAKSLELRATVSLARHWANCGEREKAHDLLAPIYGWFTEGFDTPDLREPKVLLDQLT